MRTLFMLLSLGVWQLVRASDEMPGQALIQVSVLPQLRKGDVASRNENIEKHFFKQRAPAQYEGQSFSFSTDGTYESIVVSKDTLTLVLH